MIVVEGPPNSFVGKIEIAPNWGRIQAALGLSLTQLGEKNAQTLTIKPYFGKPTGISVPIDVFLVMSFEEKFRAIYNDHIQHVATALNLKAKGQMIYSELTTSWPTYGRQ